MLFFCYLQYGVVDIFDKVVCRKFIDIVYCFFLDDLVRFEIFVQCQLLGFKVLRDYLLVEFGMVFDDVYIKLVDRILLIQWVIVWYIVE